MTATIELKPCPFCGGKCDPAGWLRGDGARGPECEECGATAASVNDWNRRAQPASVTDEAESIDDRIRILSRKLGLARNHNPSPDQLRAAGIELVRPAPPKSPPAKR